MSISPMRKEVERQRGSYEPQQIAVPRALAAAAAAAALPNERVSK